MPIPESPKPYYLKDPLDNAIDAFAREDNPTQTNLNWIETIASVQAGLDKYRAAAKHMSSDQFEDEKHNSA